MSSKSEKTMMLKVDINNIKENKNLVKLNNTHRAQ